MWATQILTCPNCGRKTAHKIVPFEGELFAWCQACCVVYEIDRTVLQVDKNHPPGRGGP